MNIYANWQAIVKEKSFTRKGYVHAFAANISKPATLPKPRGLWKGIAARTWLLRNPFAG